MRWNKRLKTLWDHTHDQAILGHHGLGGVVDHEWLVRFSFRLTRDEQTELGWQSTVHAVIQDYLSPTVKGTVVKGGADRDQLPATIPWKLKKVKVLAPCVFSESGWVQRSLTVDELLDAYDVSVADRRCMQSTEGETEGRLFLLAFMQQVPVRVLERVLVVLKAHLEGTATVGRENSSGRLEGKQPRCKTEAMDSRLPTWRNSGQLEVELSQRVGGETSVLENLEKEESGHLQAKNDDAGTNVREWNQRVCQGLEGCVYQPEVHDHALDALRELLLRRYHLWRGPLWTI